MSVAFKNKFLKDVHAGICNPWEGNLIWIREQVTKRTLTCHQRSNK